MAAPSDNASAHVLDAAERVFLERGYAGTRLRDLADALGMRPASLYHHAPGGKRELWERVVARAFDRHRDGLRLAAADAAPRLAPRLGAMARWLLAQPPVNVAAVAASAASAPGAEADEARRMSERMYQALMQPVADVLRRAQDAGEAAGTVSPDLFAGVFVAAVSGLAASAHAGTLPRAPEALAADVVALLLNGARSGRASDGPGTDAD